MCRSMQTHHSAECRPLTAEDMRSLTADEVQRAQALYPRWAHPYRSLSLSRARRILGQAHSDGQVMLSTVFLGTLAHDDLRDTIRHELAHLIVGIRARHGPRWREVAAALGAEPRAGAGARSEELRDRMDDAPWSLVAVLADGSEVELRKAYRRSPQYLNYRLNHRRFSYLSIHV